MFIKTVNTAICAWSGISRIKKWNAFTCTIWTIFVRVTEKPKKKQLIAGGGANIEYYLTQMWYHTGPSVSYKTETEIEALLAYWDQKLREVAWIDTYDDVEAYIAANLEEIGRLHLRIVISYLRGVKDLIAEKEEWLRTYQMVGREEELLEKSVSYLINRQKEEG